MILCKPDYKKSRTNSGFFGGTYESRTRLQGFADLCVTAPPTRQCYKLYRFTRLNARLFYGMIRSLVNLLHRQPLPSALELAPRIDEHGLPHYTADNLRDIAAAGFQRVGIVAAVITQETDTPQLLMLHHKPSEKVAAPGAWGPLAETSHVATIGTNLEVESAAATIFRSFEEETGMQARFLKPALPSKSVGTYTTCKWPIGHKDLNSYAFAVVPFLYLTNHKITQKLITSFKPTEEIDSATFMTTAEIRAQTFLRPGTLEWLAVVENSASYNIAGPFTEIATPTRLSRPGEDIIFANLAV